MSIIQLLLYIESSEDAVSLFKVELQKTRNLTVSEREERGHGTCGDVHAALLQSDTVQPYGRAKQKQTRDLCGLSCAKKPKDVIPSEREQCGHGKGVGVHATLMQSDDFFYSRKRREPGKKCHARNYDSQ